MMPQREKWMGKNYEEMTEDDINSFVRFMDECADEFMKALKSGELREQMSRTLHSIRAERPKESS